MAGLFGSMLPSTPAMQAGAVQAYQPQRMSLSDILGLAGAAAKQIGNGGDDINQFQQQLEGRQLAQQRLAAQQSLMGLFPQGGGQPGQPGQGGAGTDMEAALPRLAAAQAMGINTTPFLEMLKAGQRNMQVANGVAYDPHKIGAGDRVGVNLTNVNGRMLDQNDPKNAGIFTPQLDKGQEPLFDGQGRVVAIRNIDGAIKAAADMAGAVTGAQQNATAPFDFVNVPTPNGAPRTAAKSAIAGGSFEGQSPAAAEAAKLLAASQAGAQVSLPAVQQNADQVLTTIDRLKADPSMKYRTGIAGVIPAIPGTKGADFDANLAQLKGKLFLEAYATLKGGGAITETEGRKATEAMARLNTNQTREGFLTALDDLSGVIKIGKERAARQAGAQAGGAAPAISQQDAIAELKRRGKWPGGQ